MKLNSSPKSYKGVMVSSTFKDLAKHREMLIKALENEELYPIRMEQQTPVPGDDLISSSLTMVSKSSAYIGLIGHRYGQPPDSPERNPFGYSITQLEFEEAQRLQRPTLMFIMGEEHTLKARDVEKDPSRIEKLRNFRERAKTGRIYIEFNDINEFSEKAIHAVGRLYQYLEELQITDAHSTTTPKNTPNKLQNEGDVLRVSLAALIKLEINGKLLLVRSFHRPNFYSPFGGVYKYFESAGTSLDDIGFNPERERNNEDLTRDLRGFLPLERFQEFKNWFKSQVDRELPEACLKREIREELFEIEAPSALIERVSSLTFQYLWSATEPVGKIPEGFYQFRQIDVFELALSDPFSKSGNLDFLGRLLELSHTNSGIKVIDYEDFIEHDKTSDKSLANTINYLVSEKVQIPGSPRRGTFVPLNEADEYLLKFLRSGESTYVQDRGNLSRPVIVHQVRKGYTPSIVARINIDGKSCFLKYYPASNRYAKKEDWALRKLLGTECNIPRLLDSGVENDDGPAFILLQKSGGLPLAKYSASEWPEYVGPIVKQVSYFREITFPTYGEIIGEYEPVSNQEELAVYVKNMVLHWRDTLQSIPSRHRTKLGISRLISWTNSICCEKEGVEVFSTLTDVPCLCHSDIKPQDVLIEVDNDGVVRPTLLDFDNIFAFIPEYDLCKFYMYLLTQGAQLSLEDYAKQICAEATEKPRTELILNSLKATYPYVLTRLLHWAVPRNAGETIDFVSSVSRNIDIRA